MSTRLFRYTGKPTRTYGDYGFPVQSGETRPGEDPSIIWVDDPYEGVWIPWTSIEAGLQSGEWEEVVT